MIYSRRPVNIIQIKTKEPPKIQPVMTVRRTEAIASAAIQTNKLSVVYKPLVNSTIKVPSPLKAHTGVNSLRNSIMAEYTARDKMLETDPSKQLI